MNNQNHSSEARIELLEQIMPFRFLTHSQKMELAQRMGEAEYRSDECIIRQGSENDDIFLLERGSVGVFDLNQSPPRRLNIIFSGHYFGEHSALFREPRRLEVRALEPTHCFLISSGQFLLLLRQSYAFAQSLGALLRDSQGIFDALYRFRTELARSVDRGYINIADLLPIYLDLHPALHRMCALPSRIDHTALQYAVRRLPENITRTFALLLTDEIPQKFGRPGQLFREVHSAARRRDIWELLPGKNMVLMRQGISDLTDLITCLCLYAVEAEKIRNRIDDAHHLGRIRHFLQSPPGENATVSTFLASLPFTGDEVAELQAVWPDHLVQRLYEIACHREMFSIDVRRQRSNYNSRRSDVWTSQIANATRSLMGVLPSSLGTGVSVHIISSNTHSVLRCLNPWYRENAERILQWADRTNHPYRVTKWQNRLDCVYATANDFLLDHPAEREKMRVLDRRTGIIHLEETASTGIEVQLIDLSKLVDVRYDPAVLGVSPGTRSLIINIDYAFGEQAEQVMRNLLMLFGGNIVSINFFGKAGSLIGNRGDILSPTAFIEQGRDLFQPTPRRSAKSLNRLRALIPERIIHSGPILTVSGTLLQNSMMLNFYRHIWGCVGIEMEGSHYYSPVLEAKQLGIISEGVKLRFFYYVSDLPLEPLSNLSNRLSVSEGVPPLYAITRHILNGIIED